MEKACNAVEIVSCTVKGEYCYVKKVYKVLDRAFGAVNTRSHIMVSFIIMIQPRLELVHVAYVLQTLY